MPSNLGGRIIAGIALFAISPLLLLCACFTYAYDRRSVLFRQVRVGKDGKQFDLFKLRSMTCGTPGTSVTAGGDARITPVGKILRDFKLDELPQLWNVVRGDMNLIGPRPEVPRYVDIRDPRWSLVLSVKPGITDLASLMYRHEESLLAGEKDVEKFYREWLLPRKLAISMHYAKNRSAAMDLRLLGLTLRHAFLRGKLNQEEIARQFSYGGS